MKKRHITILGRWGMGSVYVREGIRELELNVLKYELIHNI